MPLLPRALALILVLAYGPSGAVFAAVPAPVISTPAAGASLNVAPSAQIIITGTVPSTSGISSVLIKLNDGGYEAATLTGIGTASVRWSKAFRPNSGVNTVTAFSLDMASSPSALVTRSFKILRPLNVPVDRTQGGVTAGFAPISYLEVGRTYMITATPYTSPAPGHIFYYWDLGGTRREALGLTEEDLYRPTIRFIHRENLTLTPVFVANPFHEVAGAYHGLLSGNADPATWGLITANVLSTGAFSAKLNLAGYSYPLAGLFAGDNDARFGTNRSLSAVLKRPGGGTITVNLHLGSPGASSQVYPGTLFCTLTFANAGATPKPSSSLQSVAYQLYFNGASRSVPEEYLGPGSATAAYTSILFAPSYYQSLPRVTMPEGFGFASVALSKAGLLTLAGQLPDGTPLTMSSPLSAELVGALYTPLYGKKGFFSAAPAFFPWTGADFKCWGTWSRPAQDTQHYPSGWPNGITLEFKGAKYAPLTGQSVVVAPDGTRLPNDTDDREDPLPPPDANGNALLQFPATFFRLPFSRSVNISASDKVISIFANDNTFSFNIFRNTGRFSGAFTNSTSLSGEQNPFQGIIYPRTVREAPGTIGFFGAPPGGFGYFLTPTPTVKTYDGKSGPVRLHYQP